DRRPSLPRFHSVTTQRSVEIIGTVGMPRVTHLRIISGGASQSKCIMPAYRIANDFHKRLHVLVEEFGVETRLRIGRSHQSSRRCRVKPSLHAELQMAAAKRQEVRTLAPSHIDDLNELTSSHLIGTGCCLAYSEVQPHLSQWWGERRFYRLGYSGSIDN